MPPLRKRLVSGSLCRSPRAFVGGGLAGRAGWRLGAHEDDGVPGASDSDAEHAAVPDDAFGIPCLVGEAVAVQPFDDDDGVEFLACRFVHVHQRDRVGFCRAAGDHLVGEDAAHGLGGRVGGLAIPDVAEPPGEGVGGAKQGSSRALLNTSSSSAVSAQPALPQQQHVRGRRVDRAAARVAGWLRASQAIAAVSREGVRHSALPYLHHDPAAIWPVR